MYNIYNNGTELVISYKNGEEISFAKHMEDIGYNAEIGVGYDGTYIIVSKGEQRIDLHKESNLKISHFDFTGNLRVDSVANAELDIPEGLNTNIHVKNHGKLIVEKNTVANNFVAEIASSAEAHLNNAGQEKSSLERVVVGEGSVLDIREATAYKEKEIILDEENIGLHLTTEHETKEFLEKGTGKEPIERDLMKDFIEKDAPEQVAF